MTPLPTVLDNWKTRWNILPRGVERKTVNELGEIAFYTLPKTIVFFYSISFITWTINLSNQRRVLRRCHWSLKHNAFTKPNSFDFIAVHAITLLKHNMPSVSIIFTNAWCSSYVLKILKQHAYIGHRKYFYKISLLCFDITLILALMGRSRNSYSLKIDICI